MISTRSPKPLDLKFRPSRLLYGYIVAVHSLVVVSVYLFLPLLAATVLALLLLLSVRFYIVRDVYFLHHSSLARIAFADNHWRAFLGDIRHFSGQRVQQLEWLDAAVLPFAVILRFRLFGGRKRSVVVLPDHLEANQYRKLRQIASFASMA